MVTKTGIGVLCATLALGCQGRPEYDEGTLVVAADVLSETRIAAAFWNQHGGAWTVERGTCSREPCVVVLLGDCVESPENDGLHPMACAPWNGDDSVRIEIQPILLELTGFDFPLVLAHEIGHVMGYEHIPGTVMAAKNWDAVWVAP
jgi:hypothetical protein